MCPALLVIYQQVYKVRHRVWSCRSQNITVSHTPYQATPADTGASQSAAEDKEQQEKLEEEDDEKRDGEHRNDTQSDG